MKYLKFPFEEKVEIIILNGRIKTNCPSELASSEIEIFQSLNCRKKSDFKEPLVLKFTNPLQQTFSKQAFNFPVEQIYVDNVNNKVSAIQFLNPSKTEGNFIQAFSEYSFVLIAAPGFVKSNKIEVHSTSIKIKFIKSLI